MSGADAPGAPWGGRRRRNRHMVGVATLRRWALGEPTPPAPELPTTTATLAEARAGAEHAWAWIATDGETTAQACGRMPARGAARAIVQAVAHLIIARSGRAEQLRVQIGDAPSAGAFRGRRRQGAWARLRRIADEHAVAPIEWCQSDIGTPARQAAEIAAQDFAGEITWPEEPLEAWVDGSWSPKDGRGGWAAVIEGGGRQRLVWEGGHCTDALEAETRAILLALEHTPASHALTVWTDVRTLASDEASSVGSEAARQTITAAQGGRSVTIRWQRRTSTEQNMAADAAAREARAERH